MVVWERMQPSWCPSPNADSILRATQDVQRELNSDCNLRDLNIIHNLMTKAYKGNGEDKLELPGWKPEDWVKPGCCLAEVCGLEGHICGGLECVKTLEKQHKQLMILFGNIKMKAKTETELFADCHGGTEVNIVAALEFYSMFRSLESLMNLEQKHEMVTAISVAVFAGVLQTEQKHIGKWREAIEAEMNIRHSETYRRPSGARYLVGSTLAPMSNMQEQIPSAFRSGGCEEYENDRGSSLLSAKMRKTCKNVSKILRVTVQIVLSSSGENQRGVRIDTGKEVHGIRHWELL